MVPDNSGQRREKEDTGTLSLQAMEGVAVGGLLKIKKDTRREKHH